MTTLFELLLFQNINLFQKYDEEGYPIEDIDYEEEYLDGDDDLDDLYDEDLLEDTELE